MFSGALDTSKIHIVSKHSINDTAMKNAPNKVLNLPFEATFRLQVSGSHLCDWKFSNEILHLFSMSRLVFRMTTFWSFLDI